MLTCIVLLVDIYFINREALCAEPQGAHSAPLRAEGPHSLSAAVGRSFYFGGILQ
jgi:hypothetical protein